ncbi:hypothetical protein P8C59_000326 [Phyllachora maydis]|uniref:Uncharacterized protein n=1 Tax=Phyllachora maydis TaxID=1825666 RepID=A0AAD9HW12_9PEZI|nr:hypothetical protein P8C59_000326 [Phyllachora maydis]
MALLSQTPGGQSLELAIDRPAYNLVKMASRQNQPGRPARPGRSIRGPQSALTDFLAAQGISANQIRSDAEARPLFNERSTILPGQMANYLPPIIIDKVARKLSKHRLLDSRTIDLFITPATEDVHVYDGGKLGLDDYIRIFQVAPRIKNLKVRNGVQFKDEVMDFLLGRDIQLESLYLHGANLLSDEKWQEFLRKRGKSLRKLQVYYTDNHFGDDTLALLATACPNLKRLKVKFNQKVTGKGIKEIAKIETLEHLGIHLSDPSGQRDYVHPDCYVYLINKVGSRLRTFSVTNNEDLDNTVLDALRNNARRLEKLRITDSRVMTDDGFARLFTGWQNPGLAFLDLQRNRHVDASKPAENRASIGLCSDGFRALMAHSGRTLRDLNVHADRHITAAAFEDVFAEHRTYPEMKRLEISFCDQVTDFIVGCAFRSCPNLRALNVFGCMRVRDVMVPRGKLLVGVPNAQGMVMEG